MTVADETPQTAPAAAAAPPTGWATVPRVNLLPPEILEARGFARTQRLLVAGVVAVILLAGAGTWWASTGVSAAQAKLDVAQTESSRLQAEKAKYVAVPQVNAQVDAAELARQQAMSMDVLWYSYLNQIALATTQDVSLSSLTASVAAPTAGSDPLAPAGIGSLKIDGTASCYDDVAGWLESLDRIAGIKGTELNSATGIKCSGDTTEDGNVTFSGTSTLTPDALSHRYDRKAG